MPATYPVYVDDIQITAVTSTLQSTTITSTGWYSADMGSYTYTGSGTFLGFSLTPGATVPDSGLEIGDTLIPYNYRVSGTIHLYSVATSPLADAYEFTEGDITSVANAIRAKHQGWSSNTLLYPGGFVSGITSLAVGSVEGTKSVSYNTPGTIRITPSSGYVGFEALSATYAPNVWDGQNTWTPAPVLITFTVQDDQIGGTYTAESGMTWGEWVNTAYNTVNFVNDNGSIKQNGGQVIARDMSIGGNVMATDEIQETIYAVIRLAL